MFRFTSVFLVFATLTGIRSAHALCSYKGKMYAKTMLSEEFHDARWVVRVRLIAADDHWSDEDDSWTLYHLQVLAAYKGKPPLRVDMFTYRDSGGFYLDKGMGHDLGGDYLLFLRPYGSTDQMPAQARHAMEVNYSCGQSQEWSKVTPAQQQRLEVLAAGERVEYHDPLPTDERLLDR